jgi:hypothetical protein
MSSGSSAMLSTLASRVPMKGVRVSPRPLQGRVGWGETQHGDEVGQSATVVWHQLPEKRLCASRLTLPACHRRDAPEAALQHQHQHRGGRRQCAHLQVGCCVSIQGPAWRCPPQRQPPAAKAGQQRRLQRAGDEGQHERRRHCCRQGCPATLLAPCTHGFGFGFECPPELSIEGQHIPSMAA